MNIDYQDTNDNFRRITLAGRLDLEGAEAIATRFTALAATQPRRVVVDLTGVSFLASIGIRTIISSAKALQHRGGRMVLLVGADSGVAKTLEATGINAVIPMFASDGEACKAALA